MLKSTVCTNANTAPSARAFFFPLRSLLFQCGKSLFLSPEVLPLMGGEVWDNGRTSIIKQTQGLCGKSSQATLPFSLALS